MWNKVSVKAFSAILEMSAACFLLAQAAAVGQTLDAKKDLRLRATGTHAVVSSPGAFKYTIFESDHFQVQVLSYPGNKSGVCASYCTPAEVRTATLDLLDFLGRDLGAITEHDLIVRFPKGPGTAYDGAGRLRFNSTTCVPKAVQLLLANAEAVYETFVDQYPFKPPQPGKKIVIKVYKPGGGGAVSEPNSMWLGAGQYRGGVIAHELMHVFQQSYPAANLSWPLTESGGMIAEYLVPGNWSPVWWQFYREDDSILYRGYDQTNSLHYRPVDFYEYLFQRLYDAESHGIPTVSADLDPYRRIGIKFLDQWGRKAGARRLAGSDQTVRYGEDDKLALREVIRDMYTWWTAAQADAFLEEVVEDWWESWILDGQLAWPPHFDARGGKTKLFIQHPSRDKTACTNYHFSARDWLGRHYLNPLCWRQYASWNAQHFDRYGPEGGPALQGKPRPGRSSILKPGGSLLLSSTGRGAPYEPRRPGISPFNARYVLIPADGDGGILKIRVTSPQGVGADGHDYRRPRVRLYLRGQSSAQADLGREWSFHRELAHDKIYEIELDVGTDAAGTRFSGGRYDQALVLVTTGDHWARTQIQTSFQPVERRDAADATVAWHAPGPRGRHFHVQKNGGFGDPVDLGRLVVYATASDRRQLDSLGFRVAESGNPGTWRFLQKLRNLKLYRDLDHDRRYGAGDTLYFDAAPRISGDLMILDLAARGTAVALRHPGSGIANATLRLAAELDGGLGYDAYADLVLQVAAGHNQVRDPSSGRTAQAFFRWNEQAEHRFGGFCAPQPALHTLPWGATAAADSRGTVSLRQDVGEDRNGTSLACALPRFTGFVRLAEPEDFGLDDYVRAARRKLEESAELVNFRLRNGLLVGGAYPRRDGAAFAPEVRAVDDRTIEYVYFDESSVDCGYPNTAPESAATLVPGETMRAQGVCPGRPRFYRVDLEPGAAALRLELSGPEAGGLFITAGGAPLSSDEAAPGAFTVGLPEGVESLYMAVESRNPVARVETDLSFSTEAGSRSGDPAPEMAVIEGFPDLGRPAENGHASLVEALPVAAGVTEASLTHAAWHYFTATTTGLHRYRCDLPALRAELFDGERLRLRDGFCRPEGWSYFKAEAEAGYFLRLSRPGSGADDRPDLAYRLVIEDAGAPMPCEPDGLGNRDPGGALPVNGEVESEGRLCGGDTAWFRAEVAPGEARMLTLAAADEVFADCELDGSGRFERLGGGIGPEAVLGPGEWLCQVNSTSGDVGYRLLARSATPLECEGLCTCGNGICDQRAGEDAGTCPADCEAVEDCREIFSAAEIPSPSLIDFDASSPGEVIGSSYQSTHGVSFRSSNVTRTVAYGGEPAEARSAPNVAINDAVFPATSSNVPMTIDFATPKSYVGMWFGNGESEAPTAVLTAYDSDDDAICQIRRDGVPEEHTLFAGLHDPAGRIAFVTLDYGSTALSESIDDLVVAP